MTEGHHLWKPTNRPHRAVVLSVALLLFNYNTLSSVNCKSFANLNRFFDAAYQEMVILEDDSGEAIALPDSFCDTDTTPGNDTDDGDGETCPYCQACSMGVAYQHVPALLLAAPAILEKKVFYWQRSSHHSQIFLTNPQRAPPPPVLAVL